MQTRLKKNLLTAATQPYRATGYVNYQWARGKLGHDPVFAALIEHKIFPDNARVLDLGCGRGLLAAWMLGAEQLAASNEWNGDAPPTGLRFHGIEQAERETQCGNRALPPLYGARAQLHSGDIRTAELEQADAIAMLDVLHYIPPLDQDALLDKIRAMLGSGGLFVTRVGNADGSWRSRLSRWIDVCVSFIQSGRIARLYCRPLAEWIAALETRGFIVQAIPMGAGTPFANTLLIARIA